MRLPFISTTSHASHPLLEKIIMLAPDRTCIFKFFGPEYFLPVEVQLQQNGYDLFECMITGLPVRHQARGDYLEAHFRPLLDATLDMVMALQHVSACTSGTEYVQTYIAVQNLIGAQKAAMAMYCSTHNYEKKSVE